LVTEEEGPAAAVETLAEDQQALEVAESELPPSPEEAETVSVAEQDLAAVEA
jgi:hypothetical protein